MLEKFSKFIGIQGVLALALVAGVLSLALTGRGVPEVLANLAYAACGFYFGAKGKTLAAQFTAWAWYAVPEWRRDRAQRDRALSLLQELARDEANPISGESAIAIHELWQEVEL